MKNIMKRAWEIYRTLTGDRQVKMSMALRQAWAESRNTKSEKEICIDRLNTIVANSSTYDYCEFEISVSDWQKNGKDRTYFSIIEKSSNRKSSHHYAKKDYGYFDNIANVYVPSNNSLHDNLNFGGNRF